MLSSSNPINVTVLAHSASDSTAWINLGTSLILAIATCFLVYYTYRLSIQSKTDNGNSIDAMKKVNRETVETMRAINSDMISSMQKVNADNQKLSLLAMKHDSNLEVYSVILAGMVGTIDMTNWVVKNAVIHSEEMRKDENGNPTFKHQLKTPGRLDYVRSKNLDGILETFSSIETKATIDLLGNEEIGMKIVDWIDIYGKAMENWSINIEAIGAVVEGGLVPVSNPQGSLLALKQITFAQLDNLQSLAMEAKVLMQSKLNGEGIEIS